MEDAALLTEALSFFTTEDLARGAERSRVLRTSFVLETALDLSLLLALMGSRFGVSLQEACARVVRPLQRYPIIGRLFGATGPETALFLACFSLLRALVELPTTLWHGWFSSHAIGLSHETWQSFAKTELRTTLLRMMAMGLLGLVLPAVRMRWPRRWWLTIGLAGGLMLSADAAADVWFVKLDHTMTPLARGELRTRLEAMLEAHAARAGEIVVIDSSRRSTAVNAFVMGVGPTSRLVLTDTLLAMGDEAVAGAVMHEIGHRRAERLPRRLAVAALALLVVLWLIDRILVASERRGLSAGRGLTVVLLASALFGVAIAPVQAQLGRAEEREADALELSTRRDHDAYIAEQVKLARANAARPGPDAWSRVMSDHPTAAERIAHALWYKRQMGSNSSGSR